MDKEKSKDLPVGVVVGCLVALVLIIGVIVAVNHRNNVRHAEYEHQQQVQRDYANRIADNESKRAEAESKIRVAASMREEIERYSSN